MAGMDDAFRAAVLAQPFDHGPRLVWADWLDECGDPRGAWLRYWCALEDAALAVPLPGAESDVGRVGAPPVAPSDRGLLALALVGLAPAGGARRMRARGGPLAARVAASAGLFACGLLPESDLRKHLRAGRERPGEGAGAAFQFAAAGMALHPHSRDLPGLFSSLIATCHRLAGDPAHLGADGWVPRCWVALAAVPAPPPWGEPA
jgi:uncharacterized protein (TIGR02996 family)